MALADSPFPGCGLEILTMNILYAIAVASGTANAIPDPTAPGGLKGWAIVAIIALIVPFAIKKAHDWAKTAPHDFLVKAKATWQAKIDKGEVDADADELVKAVGIAVAKYAEKKIPDRGMGQAKMDYIVKIAKSIPYVGWIVARYEKDFRDFFEIFVKAMDQEMKDQAGGTAPPK